MSNRKSTIKLGGVMYVELDCQHLLLRFQNNGGDNIDLDVYGGQLRDHVLGQYLTVDDVVALRDALTLLLETADETY